eukprot:Phypoly_transcript_21473.p1 GENE.Phypoly_transcript_21473~~Phypoly_transcript_21473.p1  ORF type:complete len:112 (+),score=13.02 Phypoly_transcript_21473:123-458(+)
MYIKEHRDEEHKRIRVCRSIEAWKAWKSMESLEAKKLGEDSRNINVPSRMYSYSIVDVQRATEAPKCTSMYLSSNKQDNNSTGALYARKEKARKFKILQMFSVIHLKTFHI